MADAFTGAASGSTDFVVTGIPANILTVHTNDLLFEAMPVMRYDQFAVVRTDLQAEPGDTISFSKYGNLTTGGTIGEDEDLEAEAMSKTSVTISVTEYGKAVGLTAKFLTLSFMDEMQNASILLGRDYAKVADIMLRNALFSGTQQYYNGANANQGAIDSGDTLKTTDIDNIVEVLETGNVMKYVDANGEYFVSYIHPKQHKQLKQQLKSTHQYQYPEMIFKGEVGEYGGVRFIVTANVPNGGSSSGVGYSATLAASYAYESGSTNAVALYKYVVFGERAYGWAVALPVELREDPGQTNFGRKRKIAWYAIMGAGKIVNENIVIGWSA